VLMGWVGVISGSPRIAILSVGVLFVLGALLLRLVDEPGVPGPAVQPSSSGS